MPRCCLNSISAAISPVRPKESQGSFKSLSPSPENNQMLQLSSILPVLALVINKNREFPIICCHTRDADTSREGVNVSCKCAKQNAGGEQDRGGRRSHQRQRSLGLTSVRSPAMSLSAAFVCPRTGRVSVFRTQTA